MTHVIPGKLILERANQCLTDGRIFHARYLFMQATRTILADKMSSMDCEPKEVEALVALAEQSSLQVDNINRQLESLIQHSQPAGYIEVPAKRLGFCYEATLGRFLGPAVREVLVEEPLMCSPNHFHNLTMLMELFLLHCKQLAYVEFVTCAPAKKCDHAAQLKQLESIKSSLGKFGVNFGHRYEKDLCETRLLFSQGTIVRISEHGLHYLQEPKPGLRIGYCGQRLRESMETLISINQITKKAPKGHQLITAESFSECFEKLNK